MSDGWTFYPAFISGAAGCVWLAVLLWRTDAGNLPRREAWTRNKPCGMVLGYIAFALCVPHAAVVSPDFLVPCLWPLALTLPVVCALYVDYPVARAVGGLLILLAYTVVHAGFDLHLPGAPALSILAWLAGIAGIWISAQPWRLRDVFRSGRGVRRAGAGFLLVLAAAMLGEVVWVWC